MVQSGDLIFQAKSAFVASVSVDNSSTTEILFEEHETSEWNLLTTTSMAHNELGAVGVYFLPSEGKLAKSANLNSLGKKVWTQDVEIPADSTYRVSLWGNDLLLHNSSGNLQLRSMEDISKVYLEMELGEILDLIQISSDQVLVLRENNIVESYELSSGDLLTQKQFSEVPVLFDLGGLF